MKYFVSIVLVLALASCTRTIPQTAITPSVPQGSHFKGAVPLLGSVNLGDVRVAPDINGDKWDLSGKSLAYNGMIVGLVEYRQALQSALTGAQIISLEESKAKYVLDANLISIKYQPNPHL
jgi:hypothetical protein